MKICLDAGHGGRDFGAIGTKPFEYLEKNFNLALCEYLEEQLEELGHWVVMTRRRDRTLSLEARANFANRLNADVFVSIHANAAGIEQVEGMEVFHFPGSARGRQLATSILDNMLAAFPGHRNRGIKEANFAVLRLTRMPAASVECEFLTNPEQLLFLADRGNQAKLAAAIAQGIIQTSPV